jgi:hypothetical protein
MIPIPQSPDSNDEPEGEAAVWGFLIALFIFKLATVAIIFWHMRTWESGIILGATLWYWFPPLLLLAAGPVLFYRRLRRIRKRRYELMRSEWMLDDNDVATPMFHRR